SSINLHDFFSILEEKKESTGSTTFKNMKSVLSQLQKSQIVTPENFVPLFENENDLINKYLDHLASKGNRDVRSAKSRLKSLISTYKELQEFDNARTFNQLFSLGMHRRFGSIQSHLNTKGTLAAKEAILELLTEFRRHANQGKNQSAEGKGIGSADTFTNWLTNTRTVTYKYWLPHLSFFDNFFDFPSGSFLKRVPKHALQKTPPKKPIYRDLIKDLPPLVSRQFEQFKNLKVYGISPIAITKIDGASRMIQSKNEIFDTSKKKGWTMNQDGSCGSAQITHSALKAYYDFVLKHSNDKEDFSKEIDQLEINLLGDDILLADYIEYLNINGYGKTSTKRLLELIDEISRENGFLRLGVNPLRGMTASEWHEHLDDLSPYLKNLKRSLEKNEPAPRDGKRHIKFLLNMPASSMKNSVDLIIENLFEYDTKTFTKIATTPFRSSSAGLITQLSRACPLRIHNWAQLHYQEVSTTITETQEPSLIYLKNEDRYRVFVPKKFLKNRERSDIFDISMPIPQLFNSDIERFIEIRKKLIEHFGFEDQRLFFKVTIKKGKANARPYKSGELASDYKTATKKVINKLFPDVLSRGINPHALRHLSATEFLNDNPENYAALAILLNDSLEVVLKTYAQLDSKQKSLEICEWAERRYA
ncbi:hypothetical protein, partial [Oleiphilus sp. HI0117]|uniref:hypothetical protein n=1 Tax=Oleiphilus sp. HI0117 TaxID=1822261 RepID=UPI000A633EDE